MNSAAAPQMSWSGSASSSAPDVRERILAAAVRCVETVGAQQTSTSLIARTAGVSRPTLYAYFANREELVDLAAQQAIVRVVGRMQEHCRTYATAGERAVEALMYALYDLRHLPAMAAHFSIPVALEPLSREELWFARQALEPAAEMWPALRTTMDDAAEIYVRMLISMLIREPLHARNSQEDREYLHRWWPRALGIDEPTSSFAPCGLYPTPAGNSALLGHMSRIELEHLPPGRPPIIQHRPVIMPGSLHRHLDLRRRPNR